MAMIDLAKEQAVSREEAKHAVHAAIFDLCMKEKNTCAGDYSYCALKALESLPDSTDHARKQERDAIVAWLREPVNQNMIINTTMAIRNDTVVDVMKKCADAIQREDSS